MTSSAICDFPGCQNVAHHYDSFFKKWDCEDHAFDRVVWPNLGNESRIEARMKLNEVKKYEENLKEDITSRKIRNMNKPRQSNWGKRYF